MSTLGDEQSAQDLLLGFRRPQYSAAPETYIAALAGSVLDIPGGEWPDREPDGKPVHVVYKAVRGAPRSKLVKTHPGEGGAAGLRKWSAALQDAGIDFRHADENEAATAFASALEGTLAAQAKGQAAVPMTRSLAMLQNLRGMTGAPRPFNLSGTLEQFYYLGRPGGSDDRQTAAGRWLAAVGRRTEASPVLKALDQAVASSLIPPISELHPPGATPIGPVLGASTPFGWFHDAWNRLTSKEWVELLPDRRWSDWAATVLRNAIGFGYLWEARWYEAIADRIIQGPDVAGETTWDELVEAMRVGQLLSWEDSDARPAKRKVSDNLNNMLQRMTPLVEELDNQIKSGGQSETVPDGLRRIARDENARRRLDDVIHGKRVQGLHGPNNNSLEAVRYALKERDSKTTRDMDHYGFLRLTPNNWFIVEPATEWTAVVASLSIPEPGGSTTVSHLRGELARLGLRPNDKELIRHLVAAGLAVGSADAEGALTVNSAFR